MKTGKKGKTRKSHGHLQSQYIYKYMPRRRERIVYSISNATSKSGYGLKMGNWT